MMSRKKGIFSSISRVSPRSSQATQSDEITFMPLASMKSTASEEGRTPSDDGGASDDISGGAARKDSANKRHAVCAFSVLNF